MLKKMLSAVCLTAFVGFCTPSVAQVTDIAKGAGKATKGAVDTVGDAGKTVGTRATKGAKKVGNETEKAVPPVPSGATARCRDGTYSTSKIRSGACSNNGGVAKWY